MLEQHVLPMRKSLTSESTSSQVGDTPPVSEASVSSTGKHSAKEAFSGARKEPKKPTQPAKRGRRLRTESWTISEDKALHAATAVADVILIPYQENIDSEDADSEVKENVDIIDNIDIETEAELLEEEGIDEDMMDVPQEVMPDQADDEKDITPQEKVRAPVKEDQKAETVQKTEASQISLSGVKSKNDTENKVAATKEEVSNNEIADNQIPTKGSEETVKPETVEVKKPPSTQDEKARSSFDTSTESLRLVLEDEDQEPELDKCDSDKDMTNEGGRPSEIPTSDSMPELSKICEPPADVVNESNLPVPKLTPVKDYMGGPILPPGEQASKSMEFSSKEAPVLDKEAQGEAEESKDEETVDVEGDDMTVQAVNSRLMADLTKSGAIHDNVVVLATWSVSSEDDVELDVTGATGDSMEDDVIEPDADRLKKIVTGETGASNLGENENKVSESNAHEIDEALTDLQNRLDGILAEHVPVKDIEEEIVSDVREQIDDIVTAVELNESRDEEMSRSFEESPDKSAEEDIDEDIREQLDDITAVELNEDNKEKEPGTSSEEKELHEGNEEKQASGNKKEKSKDSFEGYLLQGDKSSVKAGDERVDVTKEAEAQKNAEVTKDKKAEKERKDKEPEDSSEHKTKAAERQSSEDSER